MLSFPKTLMLFATAQPMPAFGFDGPSVQSDTTAYYAPEVVPKAVVHPPMLQLDKMAGELACSKVVPLRLQNFSPVSDAIASLGRLRSFADFPDNWDGQGSAKPQKEVISSATNLFALIEAEMVETPKVALNAEGEPFFMLITEDAEVTVTMEAPQSLRYFIVADGQEIGGIDTFNGHKVPSELQKALTRAGLSIA